MKQERQNRLLNCVGRIFFKNEIQEKIIQEGKIYQRKKAIQQQNLKINIKRDLKFSITMIGFLRQTTMMKMRGFKLLRFTPLINFTMKLHIGIDSIYLNTLSYYSILLGKRLSCLESYYYSNTTPVNTNPPKDILLTKPTQENENENENEQEQEQEQEQKEWKEIEMLKIKNPFPFYHESEFEIIRRNTQCFVDRSLLLKTLFKDIYEVRVYLIIHPRRSGKSVNLSMIRDFCQLQINFKGKLDPYQQKIKKQLFMGNYQEKNSAIKEQLTSLNIAKYCEKGGPLFEHFGTHPVVYLELIMIQGNNIQDIILFLNDKLSKLFKDHRYLLEKLNEEEQIEFKQYMNNTINIAQLVGGLKTLCYYIKRIYNKQVVVLVDEYDQFVNSLLEKEEVNHKFIEEVATLITNMLSGVGKGNSDIEKLIITGVFDTLIKLGNSGLNSKEILRISSTLDIEGYFGMSEAEVKQKLDFMFDGEDEERVNKLMNFIKAHYNGYYGVRTNYYNIWSVYSYFQMISRNYQNKVKIEKPVKFWSKSGFSHVLESQMKLELDPKLRDKLLEISFGKYVSLNYDEDLVDLVSTNPLDLENQESKFSYLLLNSGYITRIASKTDVFKIPNIELQQYFSKILKKYMFNQIGSIPGLEMRQALFERNESKIQIALQTFFEQTVSFKNIFSKGNTQKKVKISKTKKSLTIKQKKIEEPEITNVESERMYHCIMMGILYCVKDYYGIHSEQETGLGHADMILTPKHSKYLPAIIFEFKLGKKINSDEVDPQSQLQGAIDKALVQIDKKKYESFAIKNGFTNYCCITIAFSGKHVCVKLVDKSLDKFTPNK